MCSLTVAAWTSRDASLVCCFDGAKSENLLYTTREDRPSYRVPAAQFGEYLANHPRATTSELFSALSTSAVFLALRCSPGSMSAASLLACLVATITRVLERNVEVRSERQEFFLAEIAIPESPPA